MILAFWGAGFIDKLQISSDYVGHVKTNVGELNGYSGPLHARDGGPGYATPLKLFVPFSICPAKSLGGRSQKTVTPVNKYQRFRCWRQTILTERGYTSNR
jgi:hypothetical protein